MSALWLDAEKFTKAVRDVFVRAVRTNISFENAFVSEIRSVIVGGGSTASAGESIGYSVILFQQDGEKAVSFIADDAGRAIFIEHGKNAHYFKQEPLKVQRYLIQLRERLEAFRLAG